MGDGEEAAGDGGQKDCRTWWEVELDLDCDEEEGGVMLLLAALPLLLTALALLLDSP